MQFLVGLTDQRLVLCELGTPTRSYDRNSGVQLAINKKRFVDSGNMQTTYSQGWEAHLSLPDGHSYMFRLYQDANGYPEQGQNLALLGRYCALANRACA